MELILSSCFFSALAINAVRANEDGIVRVKKITRGGGGVQLDAHPPRYPPAPRRRATSRGGEDDNLSVSAATTGTRMAVVSSSAEWEYDTPTSWSQLGYELAGTLQMWPHLDDWVDQCIHPFADRDPSVSTDKVSNYDLFQQPSGLCMVHGWCYYEECVPPKPMPGNDSYNSSVIADNYWKSDTETLNIPDATIHPVHVRDVSAALTFATAQKKEVSVKTSGHSYTGASTKKNTLLLNLSKLQKYSPDGSLVECDTTASTSDAYQAACKLAVARNKDAVIRVGGGEIWDEVIRAVYKTWNVENTNKYNVLTGSAGTVSAAGGWLASGGLSGANGNMRMFGLGVDQVLHVEMVLPSGLHVRFGPTEWDESDENMIYPRTTVVTGYCNHGDLSTEENWKWEECTGDEIGNVNFHDLWYAVRGGGGGAYGVITSIYYQLHEYSPLDVIRIDMIALFLSGVDFSVWYGFVLAFFFDPESIGVSKEASTSCSSDGGGGLYGGSFFCYNGAGTAMKDAWDKLYEIDSSLFFSVESLESFADFAINTDESAPYPVGRVKDEAPLPMLTNTVNGDTSNFIMVPEDIIVSKRDELIALLMKHSSADIGGTGSVTSGGMYIMGGNIPLADDGMNSLPHHRRHGGFLLVLGSLEGRNDFNRLFYGVSEGEVVTGDNFPGALCHNHASLNFPTPLKENWAESCNLSWSKEEKEEKCMSYQEAAWGTHVLKKLEIIHSTVDPEHLFNCWDCVGYAKDDGNGDSRDGEDGGDGGNDETSSADVSSSTVASIILMLIVAFITAIV